MVTAKTVLQCVKIQSKIGYNVSEQFETEEGEDQLV